MYAKLINGYPQPAPNPIYIDPWWIGNPKPEMLIAEGYKPVRYSLPPKTPPGYIAVPEWEETEEEIMQTWFVEFAPITEEESLVLYSNELTGQNDQTLVEATETLIKLNRESD